MDLSYDAFKNGKTKPNKTSAALSYESFKANKEKSANTQAQRADLISRGEAVSVNKNKAAPSLGGSILRSVAKPIATLLVRPGQALAAASGFTEDEQTVKSKYLGDIKTSKNAKDVLKDVGRGFETVSNGIGIGALKSIGTNVAKQTVKQVAKRAAIEGAAAGFVGGVGSGLEQGKTGKDLLWEAARATGLGGAIGGVLGGAGAKLFGGKVLSAEESAMQRYLKNGGNTNIPDAGVPNSDYIQPTMRLNAPEQPLQLSPRPKTDFYVGKAGISTNPREANIGVKNLTQDQIERNTKVQYEPYITEDKLPVITAKNVKTPAKNEFKSGIQYDPQTGLPIKEVKQSPLKTIATTKSSDTPKTVKTFPETLTNKGSNTNTFEKAPVLPQDKAITPNGTEVPKVEIPAPIKAKQTKALSDIPNEEFQSKSKTAQIDFYNQDPELATKIALGQAPTPEGISRSALHRLASNDATGEAAIRLAESPAPSIYGQNLAMQNIGDRTNSLVDSIKEVLDSRKSTMSKKEFKASTEELKNIIRANQPTKQEFEALIQEISC